MTENGSEIVFISEMMVTGKGIPEEFSMWRTVDSWVLGFNAFHVPAKKVASYEQKIANASFVICIVPKNNTLEYVESVMGVLSGTNSFAKSFVIQEGPCDYFQDKPAHVQLEYHSFLSSVQGIFCHNRMDCSYFKPFNHNTKRIKTSTNLDYEIGVPEEREGIMVGGTVSTWYNGWTSSAVALNSKAHQKDDEPIKMLGMGRNLEETKKLVGATPDIELLDYLSWPEYMKELATCNYAVHLMPTNAANSFVLNCAQLQIPCISSENDMSLDLFPHLMVDYRDYERAKELIDKLRDNQRFRETCLRHAKNNVPKYHYRKVCQEALDWMVKLA